MTPFEQRVAKLIADVFGVKYQEIDLNTSHDTIENWDSLNIVQLVMAVEAEFGVDISPDDAVDFLSVELICTILREKGVK